MAVGKEIRTKIKSVQNTQKITRAMEMVAASKMRKAQERMRAARPYAEKIRHVIGHMHYAHPEYHHPFLIQREARRVGFIVITSDRGLCGGPWIIPARWLARAALAQTLRDGAGAHEFERARHLIILRFRPSRRLWRCPHHSRRWARSA